MGKNTIISLLTKMSTTTDQQSTNTSILSRIRSKHPDRVPVLVNKKEGSHLPQPANSKFLVPKVFKVANFVQIIRDELDLDNDKSIFLYNKDNRVLKMDLNMEEVYMKDMDADGFLYITYSEVKSFG